MKNDTRKERKFNPGDLVLVRKQVKSSALQGRPEKLTLKAKGPYRVLEKAGKSSYWVQKLPALQGTTRKAGKKHKEAAFRMTKIPSTLVIHKRMDSTDTRIMRMKGDIVHNPLEQNLGLIDLGSYHQADPNAPYAFERVNQIWQEDIDTEESEAEDDDETSSDEEAEPDEQSKTDDEDSEPEAKDNTTRQTQKTQNQANNKRTSTTAASRNEARPKKRRKVQINRVRTKKQQLQRLLTAISELTDKLFFISRHEPGQIKGKWHLVQIDGDDTNERAAKQSGQYHIRYYIRQDADTKQKKVKECKHWPLRR
jgi:chemotaxis protein histidine kinase CheA